MSRGTTKTTLRWSLPTLFFFLSLSFSYAAPTSQEYNDPLTRSIADTIYCKIGGVCNTSIVGQINITGDLDMMGYDITNVGTLFATTLQGSLNWSYLTGYPAACPDGEFLVELGDTVVCQPATYSPIIDEAWVNLTINRTDAYFRWNGSDNTLQLWVNNELQQDWGASTTIYQEATFLDNIFGDGSTLLNVCLPNGSTVNGAPCNATSVFSVDNIWINNIDGNATFNASKLNDTIQAFIQQYNATLNFSDTNTEKAGAQPWLYNDSTYIYFNESYFNQSVQSLAEVKKYEESIIVTTSGGQGSGVSSQLIDFEITRIEVYANQTPTSFRFEAYEQGTGTIIDKDRVPHSDDWDIEKSHALNDEFVVVNITSSSTDASFNITLTYLDNFRP